MLTIAEFVFTVFLIFAFVAVMIFLFIFKKDTNERRDSNIENFEHQLDELQGRVVDLEDKNQNKKS